MKSIKYIIAISILAITGSLTVSACGPYSPDDPSRIYMFRACPPQLTQQWHDGCRFQDYEKEQNCLLWQKITSASIPVRDIERVVYGANLKELQNLSEEKWSDNKFAEWLSKPAHKDDLDYLLTAKEIEEIREYMNNPWYYAYDNDDEHLRLSELADVCKTYSGKRHTSRYGLQLTRLYFAQKDFRNCIDLWENTMSKEPRNIIRDMTASYVGGAYLREGNRDKAVELYTESQDIGSLISLNEWEWAEEKPTYSDPRTIQLEYIFNRFPDSPLLSIRLQEYVHDRESYVYYGYNRANRLYTPVSILSKKVGDRWVANDEKDFYDELKAFARKAAASPKCNQKGMWQYALAYLSYLDGDMNKASSYLSQARQSAKTPLIRESVEAFRMLLDARSADNSPQYREKLLKDLKWIDERMLADKAQNKVEDWQYDNKLNWSFYYWQDAARKILLGEVCPRMEKSGNVVLALQLANYATNRIYQISPHYEAFYDISDDEEDTEYSIVVMPFDEYRRNCKQNNYFDYSSQFFEAINNVSAKDAADYAERIFRPQNESDRFLNERSYTDTDYICDIAGTLYLREMNYDKATEWLSKVSAGYQARTNIAKDGYFNLDPFRFQSGKKNLISDSSDYKLKFACEMAQLEKTINSDAEANRKANAKIRYAIGLRNSFGRCWYLTQYGYSEYLHDNCTHSYEREGFNDNPFAQKAYERTDALIAQALSEFTDREQLAKVQLEMMNFKTLMSQYPDTEAASSVRGRCDNYHDYALEKD